MLFFRKTEEQVATAKSLADLCAAAAGWERASGLIHDDARDLLIAYGEFESAVLDGLYPEADGYDKVSNVLRAAGHLTGKIFWRTWTGKVDENPQLLVRLVRVLRQIASLPLPAKIVQRVPEGYAFYGLYPETYVEAAGLFARDLAPAKAVCIGMRSIGTSLSSAVAAALEEYGCEAYSFTLRPRGEPFTRSAKMSAPLEHSLRSLRGAFFAVIDEGPGLSGSSLCCAAERLSELGIPDEKIVLLPSWAPDSDRFVTPAAAERWKKHRKFVGSFEPIAARLCTFPGLPGQKFADFSAGHWRERVYAGQEAHYPAAHPRHEKRKFLCVPEREDSGALLLKFAGLGKYGRAKLARARQLADAGFCPGPTEIENGFLGMQFVPGTPADSAAVNEELIRTMAQYLAFLHTHASARNKIDFDRMLGMIRRNTMLGLGQQWANRLSFLEKYRLMYDDADPVMVDGRMLPHEWIATADGFLKTDALDHHADQFYPGPQDISWDVAGMLVEWGFGRKEQGFSVELCETLMHDPELSRRLPFSIVAYLAFRLGFATFAAADLEGSPDGERFGMMRDAYALQLKSEIARNAVGQYVFSAV